MDSNDQHLLRNFTKNSHLTNQVQWYQPNTYQAPSSPHIMDRTVKVIGNISRKPNINMSFVKRLQFKNGTSHN